MKYRKQISWLLLLAVLFVSGACNSNDTETIQKPDAVLLSSELGTSIPKVIIQAGIGALESRYPETSGVSSAVKSGVNVYKITYQTTFQGEDLTASGIVAIPGDAGDYPLLSFQNGTNVLYSDAPSKNFELTSTADLENTTVVSESLASLGFVIAIADYPGFGSSESVFHPYLEKENTLPALVDMIRATNELMAKAEIQAKLSGDLFLAGYSQGGWSTMQLLKELDQQPLEDFSLVAASCGAGPYNLSQMNELVLGSETYPMPFYFPYLLHAYQLHGLISNSMADIFQEPYASAIPQLFDFETSGGQINAALTDNMAELFQPAYLAGSVTDDQFETVKSALAANSVTAWNLNTPTRLFHGDADVYIPMEISEDFLQDFRELGVGESTIRLTEIPDADHSGGVLPYGLQTLSWFMTFENQNLTKSSLQEAVSL
ncbi:S9 family peptidase [Mangrovibacterium marinum]|uniref:Pimeloyl-ACP methyl ester carboxylesterase n=1 Tax=Mangrovibacterium marinum TaxID=1639118 RepID=A0A2T5C6W5_9BACT|nr:alpha/beta hydrolase [Mangrovibacterium marinum]PTN10688.1 pimeloyl-ACP methyl ester carboxylesterase [Mangrovibacterium marinum]